MDESLKELDFYFAYSSPFSYLAFEPAMALERTHRVRICPIPFAVHIRRVYGAADARPEELQAKVRYLYADARRFAAERGITIRAPRKIYDARQALISAFFAERQNKLRPYSMLVFERFFRRELDISDPAALERLMGEAGIDPQGFAEFAATEGRALFAAAGERGRAAGVFGVPTLVVNGELFWGNDRIEWAARKLDLLGLRR